MKRWLKYVKPYTPYFILGPLCMIVEVVGEVLMPKFLAMVLGQSADATPGYSLGIMALMILTALMMMLGGMGGAYFGAKASVNFAADLRNDIYTKVQDFSFSNIDKFSSGSLVTRLTNDVTQMQNFINTLLRMCLRSPGMIIGALIMAITLRPSLATVLAVSIPLLLIAICGIVFRAFPRFSRMQDKVDGLNNTVQENVTNVRVVKSFVREDHETEKFERANADLKDTGMSAMKIMIMLSPVMTFFMNVTVMTVIWFGGKMVLSDVSPMPIEDLSAFITYCTQILNSLMMVTMMIVMFSRAMASAKRISEVLDEEPDIKDGALSNADLKVTNGEIEFKNVSFRYYKTSAEKVLDGIELKIKAGQTVGIIGSTGSGKTTLVSLITRLYDPDEGEVLVDGVNVKDYSLKNLRDGVGTVLQKNVLFSGTIEENLRWGDPDASPEEYSRFAEYAQADKFVRTFPLGYQTEIEQGGVNVSGGQKQRLCIARALLKKPKILILDDSTSAVDTATEAQIRRAFKEELNGSTKIIIAQRISSVKESDEIIVLNEGKIVGKGTHGELMESCEEYREICYSQSEKKEA